MKSVASWLVAGAVLGAMFLAGCSDRQAPSASGQKSPERHSDGDAHCHAYTGSHCHTHSDGDAHCHAYTGSHCHTHSDGDAHCHADFGSGISATAGHRPYWYPERRIAPSHTRAHAYTYDGAYPYRDTGPKCSADDSTSSDRRRLFNESLYASPSWGQSAGYVREFLKSRFYPWRLSTWLCERSTPPW